MSNGRFIAVLGVSLAAGLTGCGAKDWCAQVRCPDHKTCDPSNGRCVLDDAGADPVQDAGDEDAGIDAGADAGDEDAGIDAGADAGDDDAGIDAGVDAGTPCTPECGGLLPVCDLSVGQCVGCLRNSDCSCPTPVCDQTNACVVAGALQVDPVADGGTCAIPIPLPLPQCLKSAGSFVVDTASGAAGEQGSCSTSGGREVVYQLTLAEKMNVSLSVESAAGVAVDPVLYVRQTPCDVGLELVCRDELSTPERVKLMSLEPGAYYVFVDSYDGTKAGPTRVSVELEKPPANESCGTASDIDFSDGGNSAVLLVDTSAGLDDTQGSCSSDAGESPEVVYRLSLPFASAVSMVSRAFDGGSAAPVIYLRADPCDGGAELACAAGGSSQLIQQNQLAAGDYFLFVEGDPGAAGPTEVTVTTGPPVSPPGNDTCAAPRTITFPLGQNWVSFPIDTSAANDDYQGTCNQSAPDSREVVYRLSLPAPRTVSISSGAPDGGTAAPVIYLREGPCGTDAGPEIACDHQPPGTVASIAASLDGGEYFLYVEGYGTAGAGPTVVTVTLSP